MMEDLKISESLEDGFLKFLKEDPKGTHLYMDSDSSTPTRPAMQQIPSVH